MSSTEQAFVKAFARRNPPEVTKRRAAAPPVVPTPSGTALAAASEQAAASEATELWIDSFDDTLGRVDAAHSSIASPRIHVGHPFRSERGPQETSAPQQQIQQHIQQHTHTAYDSYVRVDMPALKPTASPQPQEKQEVLASESPEAKLAARVAKVLQPPSHAGRPESRSEKKRRKKG